MEGPVDGYRLYYGTQSGVQSIFKDVGNVTIARLDGLPKNIPIFIVCRAYRSGLQESDPSNEVVWINRPGKKK